MVPAGNQAAHLLLVNHTTKTIQFNSLKLGMHQHYLISMWHCWWVDCLDHGLLATILEGAIRHKATFDLNKYIVLCFECVSFSLLKCEFLNPAQLSN